MAAICFLRDELREEFEHEVRAAKITGAEIAPGVWHTRSDQRLYWVLDYWPVDQLEFVSVSDGAKQLRRLAKNWAYAGAVAFRRGQLIAGELRVKAMKELVYPVQGDDRVYHAFTLAGQNTLLWSAQPLKGRFAGGKMRFEEDRKGPPSRAYLKLEEALTLSGLVFRPDDAVVDLGATPGGWSYVAALSGAEVDMIDRSRPDEKLFVRFPKIRYHKGDGLNPPEVLLERATVLLSDMACEPVKLLQSVMRWMQLPQLRFMVCTLKFHGRSDKGLIREFAALAGSEIYHLWNNGHELTWVWKR